MEKQDVYKIIVEASLFGNLGLFVGSGFSKAVQQEDISSDFQAFTWNELLDCVVSRNNISLNDKDKQFASCPAIASKICKKIAEERSISIEDATLSVKKDICVLTSYYANEKQRGVFNPLLKSLSPKWLVTTNYDLLLETLLENTYPIEPNELFVCNKDFIPVYHIHGVRTNPESIVITNEDYLKMNRPHEYRMDRLAILLKESTTLMLGYSVSDVNVLTAIDWAENVYNYDSENFNHKLIVVVYDSECTEVVINEKSKHYTEIKTNSIVKLLEELKKYKENCINKLIQSEKNERKFCKILDITKDNIGNKFIRCDAFFYISSKTI